MSRFMLACLATAMAAFLVPGATAQESRIPVSISLPGPGSTVSLPLELAISLGHDRAEGLLLKPQYFLGGGASLRNLQSGAADFVIHGMPAAMLNHLQDGRFVTLMPLDDLPQYVLMVRAALKGRIKDPRDLAGRTIGIHANSLINKTTSHQLMEQLLRSAGLSGDKVRFVAQGTHWDNVASGFRSATIDAGMIDEPFATRLASAGLAYPIFNTIRPADAGRLAGAGFLRVALHGLRDNIEAKPQVAERLVRTLQTTLRWIAGKTPEQVADQLGLAGEARRALLTVLRKNPRQYSRDGRFSSAQLRETELFFRASNPDVAAAQGLSIDSMIVDRWAGRKP